MPAEDSTAVESDVTPNEGDQEQSDEDAVAAGSDHHADRLAAQAMRLRSRIVERFF